MKYRYMVLSKETLAANSLLVHMGMYASTIRLNVFLGSVILTRTRVSFFFHSFSNEVWTLLKVGLALGRGASLSCDAMTHAGAGAELSSCKRSRSLRT